MHYNLPDMSNVTGKWKKGLARTSKAAFGRLAQLLGVTEIDQTTWDDIEALLIQADLGVKTSESILGVLRSAVQNQGLRHTAELRSVLDDELRQRLHAKTVLEINAKPYVILLVGTNGSGKTTTAAKLGANFIRTGKSVLLVGTDTFRAAAVDQLHIWADRLKLPVVAGQMGSDPGAVAYDGIKAAAARHIDIVLVDTAGRLHTRYNLMEELKKICRVAAKALTGAPHAVWLVLDATTGQNALVQAKAFKDAVDLSGIILTKLDTSARGGMAFAIQDELELPIYFAGLGEKVDDLTPFDPDAFVAGIMESSSELSL
jgi:fused signal recognition particle receptor